MMIAKLVAAAALVTAIASPSLAADVDMRVRSSQATILPHERVVGPGEIAAGTVAGALGTAAAIATAPLAPRVYVDPDDSFAYYDGPFARTIDEPVVTYRERYVAPVETRPVVRGTFWNDPVGPVCTPGSLVRLADGNTYLCQ
jgi:hypothetical protein